MAIIDQEYFFDGFGFAAYDNLKPESDDAMTSLDQVELIHPPKRPLLPFPEELNKKLPKRYDLHHDDFVENADWLILQPRAKARCRQTSYSTSSLIAHTVIEIQSSSTTSSELTCRDTQNRRK